MAETWQKRGNKASGNGESDKAAWEKYLGDEKSGVEVRAEELDKRKAGWHGLIVPGEGEVFKRVALWLSVPQIWVVFGLLGLKHLTGLSVVVWICWVAPVVGYGFVCWKSRHSDGGWIVTGLVVMGFGLILSLPGVLSVLGV